MTTSPATHSYAVTGMTCGHCVGAVSAELSALPGVEAVAVDLVSGGISTVTLTAESRLRDLERVRTRRYTDADQQSRFPGDKGLEYVPSLQDKQLIWGRAPE